ncbi:unnamed protein product [Trichobilharzia szidati]|nr:unnamed protein product [Trichobilharzia szidati]
MSMILSAFYYSTNTGYNISTYIFLICGLCVYAALRLFEKMRSTCPLNYISLIFVVISLCVSVGYLYHDYVSYLISLGVTVVISAIVFVVCSKLNNLTRKGLIIILTTASVLAISGLILFYFRDTLYLRILAGICLCSAATTILFASVSGFKKRFQKLSSTFPKILEILNIFVAGIALFAAISACFI